MPFSLSVDLCTMSNSRPPEDLASAVSRMSQYQSGSELCSDASAAPHVEYGIDSRSVTLTGEAPGLSVQSLAEDIVSLIIEIWPYHERRPRISNEALSSRGWILQKGLSARRTVHYTKQQMVWQRRTCLVGDDGQVGEDLDNSSN